MEILEKLKYRVSQLLNGRKMNYIGLTLKCKDLWVRIQTEMKAREMLLPGFSNGPDPICYGEGLKVTMGVFLELQDPSVTKFGPGDGKLQLMKGDCQIKVALRTVEQFLVDIACH